MYIRLDGTFFFFTENALATSISNVCDIDQDSAKDMFECVHWGRPKKFNKGKREIYARFRSWKDSEWIKNEFFDAMKRKENSGVYVEQMYGSETASRRNHALKI